MMPVGTTLSRWTMSYFGAALSYLLLAECLLAAGIWTPSLGIGEPGALAIVHAVTLGWLLLLMIGSLLQFAPVLTGRDRPTGRFDPIAFAGMAAGPALLMLGFHLIGIGSAAAGPVMVAASVTISISIAAVSLSLSALLWRGRRVHAASLIVLVGIGCLLVTTAFGVLFALTISGQTEEPALVVETILNQFTETSRSDGSPLRVDLHHDLPLRCLHLDQINPFWLRPGIGIGQDVLRSREGVRAAAPGNDEQQEPAACRRQHADLPVRTGALLNLLAAAQKRLDRVEDRLFRGDLAEDQVFVLVDDPPQFADIVAGTVRALNLSVAEQVADRQDLLDEQPRALAVVLPPVVPVGELEAVDVPVAHREVPGDHVEKLLVGG